MVDLILTGEAPPRTPPLTSRTASFGGPKTMAITPRLPPALHGMLRSMFQYAFPRLAYQRLTSEAWREEEIEMDLLPALVDPQREAIDVGANVGHYTLRLSRLARRVHAFEPHPRLAYVLRRNLPANVSVRCEAVSDHRGEAVLTVPLYNRPVEGLASISSNGTVFAAARGLTRFRVTSSTLDELADRNIGFVKIDVEGHELLALQGATTLICRQRPTFLVEVEERHNPGSVRAVFEFFTARKYLGFFARGRQICPIADFTREMQDIARIVTTAPRKSSDYVNNFIFVPDEHASIAQGLNMDRLLQSARAADSR